jgi:hypothetical protein
VVDSEEEYEEEVRVEVEVRSFLITAHIQEIWQGTVRTLVPLVAIATHSNMLLKISLFWWPNFRRDEEETNKYN